MLKKAIILFLLLAATEFFTLSFIGEASERYLSFTALGIGVLITLGLKLRERLLGGPGKSPPDLFKPYIFLILLSVFFGALGAMFFHNQDLSVSVITERFMYFYIIYFLLQAFKLEAHEVETFVTIMGCTFAIIYLYVWLFPSTGLVYAKILADESRLTTRIFLPGILFAILALFLHLRKFVSEKRKSSLVVVVGILTVLVFSGSRMIIFPTLLCSLLYLAKNFKVRILPPALIIVSVATVFILAWPILSTLIRLTIAESSPGKSSNLFLRLKAAAFFLFDFSNNPWSLVLGNGVASQNVGYGKTLLLYKLRLGLFQSDIGLIGDYVRFGVFYLVGVILLLRSAIKCSVKALREDLFYFLIFVSISAVTLSHFGNADGIAAICVALYLLSSYIENGQRGEANPIGSLA